jgi:hypothetical protein
MTTKLTLTIDAKVIEDAKKYCGERNISLSELIEDYLKDIDKSDKNPKKYLVDDMIGVIHNPSITPENWKRLRHK